MLNRPSEVQPGAVRRTVRRLLWAVLGMSGFAFLLVPFYDLLCKTAGINGKVALKAAAPSADRPVTGPMVKLELDVNLSQQVPVRFAPRTSLLSVALGRSYETEFLVENLTDKTLVIQAIPSISPGFVAKYFKKMECFCFQRQVLKPKQKRTLPLKFLLSETFPLEEVKRLTLSYTIFELERQP